MPACGVGYEQALPSSLWETVFLGIAHGFAQATKGEK